MNRAMAELPNFAVADDGNHLHTAWRRTRAWLARTDVDQIPSHVARQIEQQARFNEILTGWVQAAKVGEPLDLVVNVDVDR